MNHPPYWNAWNTYQVRIGSSEQLLFLFNSGRYFRRQDVQAVNTDAWQGAKKSSNILVNVEELQIAERQIIKIVQNEAFSKEKKLVKAFTVQSQMSDRQTYKEKRMVMKEGQPHCTNLTQF